MTLYEELIDLKYRKGVPTFKLARRFSKHKKHVAEIALSGLPEGMLKKIGLERSLLKKLEDLKKLRCAMLSDAA